MHNVAADFVKEDDVKKTKAMYLKRGLENLVAIHGDYVRGLCMKDFLQGESKYACYNCVR